MSDETNQPAPPVKKRRALAPRKRKNDGTMRTAILFGVSIALSVVNLWLWARLGLPLR